MQVELSPEQKDLSELQYDVSIRPLNTLPLISIIVISFTGNYGYGHKGNEDAIFMEAVRNTARKAYPSANAFIFDLQEMKYEWGDMIDRAIGRYLDAIVVSDLNREGLTSLVELEWSAEPNEWLFESVEAALTYLERGFREQRIVKHYQDDRLIEVSLEAGQIVLTREYWGNYIHLLRDI